MNKLFYDPEKPSSFSTLAKLQAVVKPNVKNWLLKQDAYTLHKPARKKFVRNPYFVTNINDVWEIDLVDLQSIAKYNDNVKYLLNVIDVFSKFAYSVPLLNKSGAAITKAFISILDKLQYCPLVVRSDKGKEFLNKSFQNLLSKKTIEFQVCKNPDVKCSVIERFNRTLKTKMYKYFTYKNSYKYLDVLQKFIKGYNNSIHSSIGIQPSKVKPTNILDVYKYMRKRHLKAKQKPVKFTLNQHVRISKEKMKFAKGFEQNYSTEVFKIVKIIRKFPQPVYELCDLQNTHIDGQFYNEELTPVIISKNTQYKIDKILNQRRKKGILEYLVSWRGYTSEFNSWIPALQVKKI